MFEDLSHYHFGVSKIFSPGASKGGNSNPILPPIHTGPVPVTGGTGGTQTGQQNPPTTTTQAPVYQAPQPTAVYNDFGPGQSTDAAQDWVNSVQNIPPEQVSALIASVLGGSFDPTAFQASALLQSQYLGQNRNWTTILMLLAAIAYASKSDANSIIQTVLPGTVARPEDIFAIAETFHVSGGVRESSPYLAAIWKAGGAQSNTTMGPGAGVQPPTISSVSPSPAAPGDSITIKGSNFFNGTKVTIAGIAAPITQAGGAAMIVTVPSIAPIGPTTVAVGNGMGTAQYPITISAATAPAAPAPTISAVSTSTGTVGTSVTITGSNLSDATVTVGGAPATVTSASNPNSATFTIPSNAAAGADSVVVTNAGGSSVSFLFTVTSAPTNSGGSGSGAVVPTTAAQWVTAAEGADSTVQEQMYTAIYSTAPAGFIDALLSQNVATIAAQLGISNAAAMIFAALAGGSSAYLQAATPNAPFAVADIWNASGALAAQQAALSSAYFASVASASNSSGSGSTSSSGGSTGSSTGGSVASATDPATGIPYANEIDPSTGTYYVIDPATGMPYDLEGTPSGTGTVITSTVASSAPATPFYESPMFLLAAAVGAYLIFTNKSSGSAPAAAPAPTAGA